jgi:hypothetical protein
MRRWSWIVVLLVVVLAGIGIGVGAYHAGYDNGLVASGRATEVVRVYGRGGFFPFGLFLFPLFFILVIFLLRAAFIGRRWGGSGHWGPGHPDRGEWKSGGPSMFEDWHRRQHDQASGDHPGAGGEPSSA